MKKKESYYNTKCNLADSYEFTITKHNKKRILYLAAGEAEIDYPNITYQDKYIKRDLGGDMLNIDLNDFDLIIASPPCNYYSRANYRRDISKYSNDTKHLLPGIIKKCELLDIPCIIENVINKSLMKDIIQSTTLFYYEIGRHCYFTNRVFDFRQIPQIKDNIQSKSTLKRQGGINVNSVFLQFIETYIDK